MKPEDVVNEAWESAHVLQALGGERAFFPSKEALVLQGRVLANYLYPEGSDDDTLNAAINDYIAGLARQSPQAASIFEHQMRVPDQQITNIGAARWYQQGLPVIRLGHKRAAALMATGISREVLEFVKPPAWAFFIELPDGLLQLRDHDGTPRKATGILVHVMRYTTPVVYLSGAQVPKGDLWRYIVITGSALTQWKMNRTVAQFVHIEDEINVYEGFGLPRDDYDHRIDVLVSRLIAGVCLMMSSPENLKTREEAVERTKSGKRPASGSPTYKVFTEAQPINVDVRRAIANYLGGDRNSPDVRLLVRGHWKNQPYGPGRLLRRLIHIEPYWRGGEEEDIIMQRIYEAGMEKK